jgi:hypothetical protein
MSLFRNNPLGAGTSSPYARERIEKEIAHLKKSVSVRDPKQQGRTLGAWVLVIGVLGLLWLFFMDPVLRAFKRNEAIHAYLYLHSFGSDAKAQAIAATGVFTPSDIERLNRRQGSFQDYFATPAAATQAADAAVAYFKGVKNFQEGRYEKLDRLGKLRYQLFLRFGLRPPTQWSFIDPSVSE